MKKQVMTDSEFLEKIKNEIPGYQIGFHNICEYKYKYMADKNPSRYLLETEDITGENIADHILTTGLNIPSHDSRGLCSTVAFCIPLTQLDINWNWNPYNEFTEKNWNIVVGLPYFLEVGERKYFIGDFQHCYEEAFFNSVVNNILFGERINPEFIYGYYGKRILETPNASNNFCIQLADELEFRENPIFWKNLSKKGQSNVIQEILYSNKEVYAALQLANNDNEVELLSLSPENREIIRRTRIQRQNYLQR